MTTKPNEIDPATGLTFGDIRAELAEAQADIAAGRISDITAPADSKRFFADIIARGHARHQARTRER